MILAPNPIFYLYFTLFLLLLAPATHFLLRWLIQNSTILNRFYTIILICIMAQFAYNWWKIDYHGFMSATTQQESILLDLYYKLLVLYPIVFSVFRFYCNKLFWYCNKLFWFIVIKYYRHKERKKVMADIKHTT